MASTKADELLWRRLRAAAMVATAALVSGCSALDVTDVVARLPPYVVAEGKPKNVIQQAMSACSEKTEGEEVKCVKSALKAAGTTVAELAALVPGCRTGTVCQYRYTTRDRLGFIAATSADFVVHWLVTFDLRHPSGDLSLVPITVAQVGG